MSTYGKIGETSRGFWVYAKNNEAGGVTYYDDTVPCGVFILDTCLFDPESFVVALKREPDLLQRVLELLKEED